MELAWPPNGEHSILTPDLPSPVLHRSSTASALLSQDVLLTYIQSQQAQQTPAGPGRLSPRPSSAATDMHRRYEVAFAELTVLSIVGEGSFGKVYLAR